MPTGVMVGAAATAACNSAAWPSARKPSHRSEPSSKRSASTQTYATGPGASRTHLAWISPCRTREPTSKPLDSTAAVNACRVASSHCSYASRAAVNVGSRAPRMRRSFRATSNRRCARSTVQPASAYHESNGPGGQDVGAGFSRIDLRSSAVSRTARHCRAVVAQASPPGPWGCSHGLIRSRWSARAPAAVASPASSWRIASARARSSIAGVATQSARSSAQSRALARPSSSSTLRATAP